MVLADPMLNRRFGRTPSRWQTQICQSVFKQLEAKGFLHEQPMQQLYRWGVWGVFV